MEILLFDTVCLYDISKDETILYGQYKSKFNKIHIENEIFTLVFCDSRPDFYIKMTGKVMNIEYIVFYYDNSILVFSNIELCFPFENCDLILDSTSSAIISTLCKNYSHRLDEWIKYNLDLGFSGIIIFNNDDNNISSLNESLENCINKYSTEEICEKYYNKVWVVNFPYVPILGDWNTIQRISLHIGVNAFRNKCRNIALIDADEFIYIPRNPSIGIENFLKNYGTTITIKSNILTNENDDDILNNNILQLAKYVGENKYTKIILNTNNIQEKEFIVTPHEHEIQNVCEKEEIIHYHCWMNGRYEYNESMPKIEFLAEYNFIN